MDNNNIKVGGGLGFFDVLLLINIVLKLTGVINWSWALVLWPLWVGLGLLAIILIIFSIMKIAWG
jgi:hypothetical protein